jgi:peroxiredoxin
MKLLCKIVVVAIVLAAAVLLAPAFPQTSAAPGPAVQPVVLGFPMPDFSLPAIQGGTYGPSALKGKNVLVIFPRGKVDDTWCWICHYQYAELAALEAQRGLRKAFDLEVLFVLPYDEAEVRHWVEIFPSQMAVIQKWTNPPGADDFPPARKERLEKVQRLFARAAEFGKGPMPTPFPILVDKDGAVSKRLGLFRTDWDGSAVDQNVPTTVLLDASGEVRFKYTSQVTFDRPNAAYIIQIMEKLIAGR